MTLLTFDIEISNVFDLKPGEDLDRHAPFDISVAATKASGQDERLWLSRSDTGEPKLNLDRSDAAGLLDYLEAMQREGHMLVAWNGLSFDLRWIGHAAGNMAAARRVALKLHDPMYQFYKLKGFVVGLAKVGQGFGIEERKLMKGADAPKEWRAGNHQAVCDYVKGDVRLTDLVAERIAAERRITWITQKGTRSSATISRLRTVEDCMTDPMPDQSWMNEPLEETRFTGWLYD